jgi:hypothetical protein
MYIYTTTNGNSIEIDNTQNGHNTSMLPLRGIQCLQQFNFQRSAAPRSIEHTSRQVARAKIENIHLQKSKTPFIDL